MARALAAVALCAHAGGAAASGKEGSQYAEAVLWLILVAAGAALALTAAFAVIWAKQARRKGEPVWKRVVTNTAALWGGVALLVFLANAVSLLPSLFPALREARYFSQLSDRILEARPGQLAPALSPDTPAPPADMNRNTILLHAASTVVDSPVAVKAKWTAPDHAAIEKLSLELKTHFWVKSGELDGLLAGLEHARGGRPLSETCRSKPPNCTQNARNAAAQVCFAPSTACPDPALAKSRMTGP
jgi:hypothetical protein